MLSLYCKYLKEPPKPIKWVQLACNLLQVFQTTSKRIYPYVYRFCLLPRTHPPPSATHPHNPQPTTHQRPPSLSSFRCMSYQNTFPRTRGFTQKSIINYVRRGKPKLVLLPPPAPLYCQKKIRGRGEEDTAELPTEAEIYSTGVEFLELTAY